MDYNKDYYKVLGVSKTSSDDDIRKAFRKLAVENHPDKNSGDKNSESKFKNINDAYQILSDSEKKAIYDQQSPFGKHYSPNTGFNPFKGFTRDGGVDDIFSQIFRQHFSQFTGTQEQFHENLDINIGVKVDFSQTYSNIPITISYNRNVSCDRCEGSGFDPDSESFECEICDGKGVNAYGFVCEQCSGKRKIFSGTCTKCNGEKVINKKENFQLNNTYQIDKPLNVRKTEYGHQSKYYRSRRGNLNITINFEHNSPYKVAPRGLEYIMDIHYEDAIKGVKRKLELPDGKKIEITIPPRTKDNDILKVVNRGAYAYDGKTRTDLFIIINIIIDYSRLKNN